MTTPRKGTLKYFRAYRTEDGVALPPVEAGSRTTLGFIRERVARVRATPKQQNLWVLPALPEDAPNEARYGYRYRGGLRKGAWIIGEVRLVHMTGQTIDPVVFDAVE